MIQRIDDNSHTMLDEPESPGPGAPSVALRLGWRPLIILGLIGLILYLPGAWWGLPATTSWSQDTIAGMRTLGPTAHWPQRWLGRYPPLHYFILRAVYEPVLAQWQRADELIVNTHAGVPVLKPPHAPKLGLLYLLARFVSVLAALAASWGMYAVALRLTQDRLAAWVAALILMTAPVFAYFACLGNVDVPALAWCTWSIYFYVCAVHRCTLLNCAVLGLLGSAAIATKESTAGLYPGMAVVLLAVETRRQLPFQRPTHAFRRALLQPKWPVGLLLMVLPYLLIFGAFFNWDGYIAHVSYWLGITPDTTHAAQYRWPNQFALLGATFWYAASGVGWPLLAALVAAYAYALKRYRAVALTLLLPTLSYYLIVIVPQGFVYARFLLPILVLAAVPAGLATADLYRNRRLPELLRLGVPLLVALLSLGYLVALKLETLTDSRYAAEAWFVEHVEPSADVGAFSKPQYLPRVQDLGYPTYAVEMSRAAFEQPQPEYLILTSYNYEDFDARQLACMEDLLNGRLGYKPVAFFQGHYLGTGSSWLSLAGWYTPNLGKLSPRITVLQRNQTR